MARPDQAPAAPSLQRVANEARRRGHYVRMHRLQTMPEHWRKSYIARSYGLYGQQDLCAHGARIEVGYIPSAEPELVALALCHELGHAEQVKDIDYGALGYGAHDKRRRALIEVDAWERALVIWGELGYEFTPYQAGFVVACLFGYKADKHDPSGELLHWLFDYSLSSTLK